MPVSTECAAALLSFRYPSFSNSAKRYCKSVRVEDDEKREKEAASLLFIIPRELSLRLFSSQLMTQTVLRGGETRLQVLVYVSISVSQSAPEYYNLLHWLTQILLQLIIRSWKFEPQKIPFSYWAFSDRKHHKKSFVKYQPVLEPNFGMLQFN